MRRIVCLVVILLGTIVACTPMSREEARKREIAAVLAAADEPFLRSRPRLMAGKYARMAANPFDYYRGTVPLSWHDYRSNNDGFGASEFAMDVPLAPVLGDPHPENFGVLLGADGQLTLEPNDFDSADFAPYLWDVRRLVTGMALAARLSNSDDPMAQAAVAAQSRQIAKTAAQSYALTISALAQGAQRTTVDNGGGDPNLEDVFSRAAEDLVARSELSELTVQTNGVRALRRGVLDPAEPTNIYLDLPSWAYDELPKTLEKYRQSLLNPPDAAYFQLLDAVRELGSGVASWARVRIILLVRGPSDDPADDVLLELKELTDSGLAGAYPPFVHYDDVGKRIRETTRSAWVRPDAEPLWGTSDYFGWVCQVKLESEAQKTIRVRRMVGSRGTFAAIDSLSQRLGEVLARVHAATPKGSSSVVQNIDAIIGRDSSGFAEEQADVAQRYADRVLLDHTLFREALDEFGPRLGLPFDAADTPSSDVAAIIADDYAP